MRLKNLEKLKIGGTDTKMLLGVPPPRTPGGRVYRFSPNEKAYPRHFVIGDYDHAAAITEVARGRMKLEPRSSQTVCPYSGMIAPDAEFLHPDDRKAVIETVRHAAVTDMREAVQSMLRDAFSGSKFKVRSTGGNAAPPKPRFLRDDLLRELICDHCSRDYGVYAIGLFCPDCGAPNLRLHFAREADLVRIQADLAEAQTENNRELAYRLLGNAHEDVLTAFEATLKTVYLYGVGRDPVVEDVKPVKNDFQNVEIAQKRFSDFSLDPFSGLTDDELETLKLNIQKRHIIGHNLGVVDEKFAEHTKDARIGETVHLLSEDVKRFADIAQKVVDGLDVCLGGGAIGPQVIRQVHVFPVEQPSQAAKEGVETLDLELSPLARRLGLYLAEQCKDGLSSFASEDDILSRFANEKESDLQEAIAELQADGFIDTHHRGSKLPFIRLKTDLYITFDRFVLGSDPTTDSLQLAELVLNGADSVSVAKLHEQSTWPQRRFNPAVALVIAQIEDRRVSKAMNPMYPATHFHMLPVDRVALRRFSERHRAR